MQHGSTKYKCAIRACHHGFSPTTTNHPSKSTAIRARQDVQQDTTEIKSLSPPSQAEELATMPPPPPVDSATCIGIRHELLSPLYGNSGGGGAITSKYVFNWFRVAAVNAGMNFPKSLSQVQSLDPSICDYIESAVQSARKAGLKLYDCKRSCMTAKAILSNQPVALGLLNTNSNG